MAADFFSNLSLLNVANETGLTQETVATTSQSATDSTASKEESSQADRFSDLALIPKLSAKDIPPTLGAKLSDGTLTITGSNDNDNILVFAKDGMLHIREVTKEVDLLTTPVSGVTRIVVNAHQGDDWINIDHNSIDIGATIRGGSGNDQLLGGSGNDTISGDSGHDELVGYGGDDTLKGADGDDLLIGGDGRDRLYGGRGDDYLVGGQGNDLLMGADGNDNLFAEAGDDQLYGGDGDNLMVGGDGNDRIYGGSGIDAVYAGAGDDEIRTFDGDDRIRGEEGNDNITGDNGNDYIVGGPGDDVIQGLQGNDLISGGEGNDKIFGGAGQDWLDGGEGHDRIEGHGADDWLQGGVGRDTLDGGEGNDQVHQDFAPGEIGSISQASIFGGLKDFAGDLWDQVTEAFEWTWDKASSMGRSLLTWAVSIDDRIARYADHWAETLTNWPWHPEFWKSMGRLFVDSLELAGLAESWQTFFELFAPWQRGMNDHEIEVARSVFGHEINLDNVRIDEYSVPMIMPTTTNPPASSTGYLINSLGGIEDTTLIHQLAYVWQYEEHGLAYLPETFASLFGEYYGGVEGLRDAKEAGQGLSSFDAYQKANIVKDYFTRREDAKANGASQVERDELDLYIHFVQEASTLSPEELGLADDPTANGRFDEKLALDFNDRKSHDRSKAVDQRTVLERRLALKVARMSLAGDPATQDHNRAEKVQSLTSFDLPVLTWGPAAPEDVSEGEWGDDSLQGKFSPLLHQHTHQSVFSEIGSFRMNSRDTFSIPILPDTAYAWVDSRIASDGEDELPVAESGPEGEDEDLVLSKTTLKGQHEMSITAYAPEGEDELPVLSRIASDGKDELPMTRFAPTSEEHTVLAMDSFFGDLARFW